MEKICNSQLKTHLETIAQFLNSFLTIPEHLHSRGAESPVDFDDYILCGAQGRRFIRFVKP